MDEDFIDVTAHSKKPILGFVLLIIVIAILGYFLVFRTMSFSVKNVKVELGETVSDDVADYLTKKVTDIKDYKLDISKVNTNEVGEYTYTVTHKKTVKKGKISIVDTTAPEFTLKTLIVEEGSEDYYLGDFLATCIDASKPCLVNLKDDKDADKFGKTGSYKVNIVVQDIHGNKKEATAELEVVEKGTYVDPRSKDLVYHSNSLGEENFNGKIYLKLDKALDPDSEEARDKMNEISTVSLEDYVKNNHSGYNLKESEIVELFNKSGFIIGYSIKLTIDNGKESIVYVDGEKAPIANGVNDNDEREE